MVVLAVVGLNSLFTMTGPAIKLPEPPGSPLPPRVRNHYSSLSRIIYTFCLQSYFSKSSSPNPFIIFVLFCIHCLDVLNKRWLFVSSTSSLIVSKIERGPNLAPEARRAPGAARAPHPETGPTCARGHANRG